MHDYNTILGAVSYTHLDVYKRQISAREIFLRIRLAWLTGKKWKGYQKNSLN